MTRWKTVAGHCGKYEVSDEGDVRTLDWRGTGQARLLTPTPSGGTPGHKGKYLKVGLSYCEDGRSRRVVDVHRLVAETFLPNPDNLPCVQHLDDNPQNNCVENLAWSTYHDNNVHNGVHERRAESLGHGVVGVGADGEIVRFRSPHAAVKALSGSTGGRLVTNACHAGGGRYAYGYHWWWADEYVSE